MSSTPTSVLVVKAACYSLEILRFHRWECFFPILYVLTHPLLTFKKLSWRIDLSMNYWFSTLHFHSLECLCVLKVDSNHLRSSSPRQWFGYTVLHTWSTFFSVQRLFSSRFVLLQSFCFHSFLIISHFSSLSLFQIWFGIFAQSCLLTDSVIILQSSNRSFCFLDETIVFVPVFLLDSSSWRVNLSNRLIFSIWRIISFSFFINSIRSCNL